MLSYRLLIWSVMAFRCYGNDGTYFEEMFVSDGHSVDKSATMKTPLIHKAFHKCSISNTCKYVVENTETGSFTHYENENEIPADKTKLRIWKKMQRNKIPDKPDLKYCQEIYSRGSRSDGIFTINIPEIGPSNVRCDMTTGNGGWIVFQRRVDATVDFNRIWVDHKVGFGDLDGNFWLGLEKIHQLAAPGKGAKLRVDVKPVRYPGVSQHAEYSRFEIGDESDGYRLRIGGYTGNAGDHLAYHDNMKFSTKDRDQDMDVGRNCAVAVVSAWWFNNCRDSNLNGLYPPNSEFDSSYMIWGPRISNFSEMKIKY